jgi:hypothetical protein
VWYQCGSHRGAIYHLLCRSLGQEVSVSQVVDFDVLDVVAVGHVHLAIDIVASGGGRARADGGCGRLDRRDVDMLDALAGLELGVDASGGRGWRGRGSVSMSDEI